MPEDGVAEKAAVLEGGIFQPSVSGEKNSSYETTIKVVNSALQEIGMGRYQWYVLLLCASNGIDELVCAIGNFL